jgi:predicted nucleic acid-binding protein
MSVLVVDASVAAKWFLPEADAKTALRLLDGRRRLAAPDLIYCEVGNIIWKHRSRDVLSEDEASQMVEDFLAMPLEIHDNASLLASALEIATAAKRTVYDSSYLALAIELDTAVVTADERWVNAVKGGPFARYVRLLGRR